VEFIAGVALLGASIYFFLHGSPLLGGVLGGLGVVFFGGGVFRRRGAATKKPDA